MSPADISMVIIIHIYSKRKRYILRTVFFLILTFSALRVGLRFFEKNQNFRYVSSWVDSVTKGGKSGINAGFKYKNDNFVIQGLDKMWEYPIRNFDLISPTFNKFFFLIWHRGTRWHIYQMRSADIYMLIIIQLYRKGKVTYYELCSSFF